MTWHDKQVKADVRVAAKLAAIHRAMNVDRVSGDMDVADARRLWEIRSEVERMKEKYEKHQEVG